MHIHFCSNTTIHITTNILDLLTDKYFSAHVYIMRISEVDLLK